LQILLNKHQNHLFIQFNHNFLNSQGFKIYINGNFHCCLRFKQLRSLHEQLKKSLLNLTLPQFPPKKILTLTKSEIDQRRIALERYLQLGEIFKLENLFD
jgi:hypothetical protein